MITEHARFDVKPGLEQAFEAMVQESSHLFTESPGCRSVKLTRSVEAPGIYVLVIEWDSVEDHTVRFRGSQNFIEWRRRAGSMFQSVPHVEHFNALS